MNGWDVVNCIILGIIVKLVFPDPKVGLPMSFLTGAAYSAYKQYLKRKGQD